MSHPTRRLFLAAGASAFALGCARWTTTPEEPSKLPPAKMSPDSVVLEIAFVRLPAADKEASDTIWEEADEQHFPPELRRQLAANGLRAGILGQQLPANLRAALDAATPLQEERAEDLETNDTQASRTQRRLQCRAGHRAKIVVSKTYPSLSLLTKESGRIGGSQLSNAQCLFALKPYPLGDGRVRIDVTPEVEHGELRNQWAGQDGTLMQRIGRQRVLLDKLRAEATLSPGQVLLVSTTPDFRGIGEHFFVEQAGGTAEITLLLVRVAQTQWDDLFAPEQVSAPLATPGE